MPDRIRIGFASSLPRGSARRELLLFVLAYMTYFGVRAATEGSTVDAVRNALRVFHVERTLDLDWEDAAQGAVLGSHALLDAANAVYIWGHWPLLIVGATLLFCVRRVLPAPERLPAVRSDRPRRLRAVPGRPAASRSDRPGRHGHRARARVPHGPSRGAGERVRRDAQLPRGLEPAAGDRAVPSEQAPARAHVRGRHAGHDGVRRRGHGEPLRPRRRGRRPHRHARARAEIRRRRDGAPITVCSRSWALLAPLRALEHVRVVHSVGSRRQLAALRRGLAGPRLAGVSIHRRLLDPATVADLRAGVDLVLSWPVATAADARMLWNWGVNGVISERFEALAAALRAPAALEVAA